MYYVNNFTLKYANIIWNILHWELLQILFWNMIDKSTFTHVWIYFLYKINILSLISLMSILSTIKYNWRYNYSLIIVKYSNVIVFNIYDIAKFRNKYLSWNNYTCFSAFDANTNCQFHYPGEKIATEFRSFQKNMEEI